MDNWISKVPVPKNEPVRDYLPGDANSVSLKQKIAQMSADAVDIPIIINGEEIRTGKTSEIHPPHNHAMSLGKFHHAGPKEIQMAIEGSQRAYQDWSRMSATSRAAIFLKAGELLASTWRDTLNASTMLCQSKTCHQAEIDAACEMIDFLRFNVAFQRELYEMQPLSAPGQWNQVHYRPLEGFVFAVTPFNFTSIAGNLPSSAALMGNVSLWKPASTAVYSGYFMMKLFEAAGLPPGVIQFVPGSGREIGTPVMESEHLAGVHFTGSTEVFQGMWKTVGERISQYRTYPRIVGETGGKDFVFAHPSADVTALVANTLRGAFEYQGQKCSAASRAYIPNSLWGEVKERLVAEINTVRMGDISDFGKFMGAVIDKSSFDKIKSYIDYAKDSPDAKIIAGGTCNEETGYFIEPTVIETTNPKFKSMCEEIFGPVLTVYAYEDSQFEKTLELCDQTSPYALTGCIWADDRRAVDVALQKLRHSAGNFYINNKPTGAVVGQQPFGGSRASGTNDKAGSLFNLVRWVSMRMISETFVPPGDYRYPFLGE